MKIIHQIVTNRYTPTVLIVSGAILFFYGMFVDASQGCTKGSSRRECIQLLAI